jgi:4-amino-4-deoxy-L-arabinose transferase-like glycosyltransferase
MGAAVSGRRPRLGHRAMLAAVLVIIAAGIAFRFWLADGPLREPSSDESVVGLMALELLHHGHLRAFYWGQFYGGSLESILVAPWIWLFGANTFALKLTSVLAGLVSSWLTWRIARHLFRPVIAAWSGLLSLFWPATLVWFGTKEAGFYPVTAALGLLVVLMAVNIDEHPERRGQWLALGLAAGVGWWMSPNIAYYALPMAAWLVVRGQWKQTSGVVAAVAGFVAGSSVWIVANVRSGFASLRTPPGWAGSSTFLSRFQFFWRAGLPFSFGLRQPFGNAWYDGRYFGFAVYAVAIAALLYVLCSRLRPRVSEAPMPDLLLIAAAPFVYATFAGNWHLYEGRYTYFVASFLPILLGRVMHARAGALFVLVLAVVPGVAFMRDYDHNRSTIGPDTRPIASALERAGYSTAVAQYAIAYQLTYESDEKVIVAPATDDRYPPYVEEVRRSTPAYVFYSSDAASERALTDALVARHIRYRVIAAGRYSAVLPSARYIVPTLRD